MTTNINYYQFINRIEWINLWNISSCQNLKPNCVPAGTCPPHVGPIHLSGWKHCALVDAWCHRNATGMEYGQGMSGRGIVGAFIADPRSCCYVLFLLGPLWGSAFFRQVKQPNMKHQLVWKRHVAWKVLMKQDVGNHQYQPKKSRSK